jgi:cell division GTPase FtsZ
MLKFLLKGGMDMGLYLKSNIKKHVEKAFENNNIEDSDIKNAINDALIAILTDRTVIKELTETITEIQSFERDRRNRFRG